MRSDTKIKKMFDREFNSPKLYMLRAEFTKDNKINAKGRVQLRNALFFISIMFLIDDSENCIEALMLISLLWLTVPAALTLAGPLAKKMIENEYNLYDILAGIGTYIIFGLPLIVGEFFLMRYLPNEIPEMFEGINYITGLITALAILVYVVDIWIMLKEKKKN